MLDRIRHRVARLIAPGARHIAAAGGGRRASTLPVAGNIGQESLVSGTVLRKRARGAYLNNGFITNAVNNWVGASVGSGIVPTSRHPDKATKTGLVGNWRTWNETADYDGLTSFDGLLQQVMRSVIVDGEAFLQWSPDGKLRMLLPEQFDSSLNYSTTASGGYIVQSVEYDANGQRVAYLVRPIIPGNIFETWQEPVRVPAADIIHVFLPLFAGQVRGISWLSASLMAAAELDAAVDGLITALKVSGLHAVTVSDVNSVGGDDPYEDLPDLQPGSVVRLPAGVTASTVNPQAFTQSAPLISTIARQIAGGLGLPTFMVDSDLTGANYSSLRAGLIPFRSLVEQRQFGMLVPQLMNPVWQRVTATGVLSGALDAPDYEANPTAYGADWTMPAVQQVDPLKSVQADSEQIAAGLMSRRQAVAARGWDVDALDEQIAADNANAAELGLSFPVPVPVAPAGEDSQ